VCPKCAIIGTDPAHPLLHPTRVTRLQRASATVNRHRPTGKVIRHARQPRAGCRVHYGFVNFAAGWIIKMAAVTDGVQQEGD